MKSTRLTLTISIQRQTGSNSITECEWTIIPFFQHVCAHACRSVQGPWALRRRWRGPPWTSWRSRGAMRHAVGKWASQRYHGFYKFFFQIKVSRFLQFWVAYWEWSWASREIAFIKFNFCKFQRLLVRKNFPSLNNCPFTVKCSSWYPNPNMISYGKLKD